VNVAVLPAAAATEDALRALRDEGSSALQQPCTPLVGTGAIVPAAGTCVQLQLDSRSWQAQFLIDSRAHAHVAVFLQHAPSKLGRASRRLIDKRGNQLDPAAVLRDTFAAGHRRAARHRQEGTDHGARCPPINPPNNTELFRWSCGNSSLVHYGSRSATKNLLCHGLPPTDRELRSACEHPKCGEFQVGKPQTRWVENWMVDLRRSMHKRHMRLRAFLDERPLSQGGVVMLIAVNAGFMTFFDNWLNNADAHGIDVRSLTLMLTSGGAVDTLAARGMTAWTFEGYAGSLLFPRGVSADESVGGFALGQHTRFNAVALLVLSDFLLVGQDVLWQDADVVWRADPRPWLTVPHTWAPCKDVLRMRFPHLAAHRPHYLCLSTHSQQPHATRPDVQMMDDGTWDNQGPGNTGFVLARSNCRTKWLARTITQALPVLLGSRSDQRFVNSILLSNASRHLSIGLLPLDAFPNALAAGHQARNGPRFVPPTKWMVAHASWTHDARDKVQRFRNMNAWNSTMEDSLPAMSQMKKKQHADAAKRAKEQQERRAAAGRAARERRKRGRGDRSRRAPGRAAPG